jgi:hypothetical protein
MTIVIYPRQGITMLVNNAGVASVALLLDADIEKMGAMVDLNVTALTRLTGEDSHDSTTFGRFL